MLSQLIKNQHCPNQNCEGFGKIGSHNIAIHDFKNSRFRCRLCGKTWVSHREQILYYLKTKHQVLNRALDLLKAGYSIRVTAKFSHVSPSTIMRWKKRMNMPQN